MCFAPTISLSSHTVPTQTICLKVNCYVYLRFGRSPNHQTARPVFHAALYNVLLTPPPPTVASPSKPSRASREAESLLKVRHQILMHVGREQLHWGKEAFASSNFSKEITRIIWQILFIYFLYFKKVTISNILHPKASIMHRINTKISKKNLNWGWEHNPPPQTTPPFGENRLTFHFASLFLNHGYGPGGESEFWIWTHLSLHILQETTVFFLKTYRLCHHYTRIVHFHTFYTGYNIRLYPYILRHPYIFQLYPYILHFRTYAEMPITPLSP